MLDWRRVGQGQDSVGWTNPTFPSPWHECNGKEDLPTHLKSQQHPHLPFNSIHPPISGSVMLLSSSVEQPRPGNLRPPFRNTRCWKKASGMHTCHVILSFFFVLVSMEPFRRTTDHWLLLLCNGFLGLVRWCIKVGMTQVYCGSHVVKHQGRHVRT